MRNRRLLLAVTTQTALSSRVVAQHGLFSRSRSARLVLSVRGGGQQTLLSTEPPKKEGTPTPASPEIVDESWRSILTNRGVLCLCVSTGALMLGHGVATPIIPALAQELDASASTVGLALSAFGASRLVLNVPIGWVSDRIGRKPVLVFGGFFTAIGSCASAFAPDMNSFIATRALAGAGNACYLGTAQAYLADAATPRTRARVLGMNQAALLFGVSLGPALGGLCAELFGLRSPFLVVGALSAASGLASYVLLDETASAKEKKIEDEKTPLSFGPLVWSLIADPRFLSVGACQFSTFALRQGGRNLVLALVATSIFDYTPATLGGLYAAMALVDLLLLAPAATVSDYVSDRRLVAVPSLLATAVAVACVGCVAHAAEPSHDLFLASLSLWSLSTAFLGPTLPAFASDIAPPEHRALAISLFRSCGDLGFVVAPVALGLLQDDFGPRAASLCLASATALSALAFARYGALHPPPKVSISATTTQL